jgi:hypothetical protein
MTHTEENIITALKGLMKEQTGYPVKHTESDCHAHYFSNHLLCDINEEVKVVIDDSNNKGKWEVFSRYEGMEDWHTTDEFVDSKTLEMV